MPYTKLSRRACLRGIGGVAIGLPTLEAMLNTNGDAFADGTLLPPRYVICFGGFPLGTYTYADVSVRPTQAGPENPGRGYDVTKIGLVPFAGLPSPIDKSPIRDQITIVSGLAVPYGPKTDVSTDISKIPPGGKPADHH